MGQRWRRPLLFGVVNMISLWYTLPPQRIGDHWTLGEVAQLVRMNVNDFVHVNTQRGAEDNLLQQHVTFKMPDVLE